MRYDSKKAAQPGTKSPINLPTRTREHHIADLSLNHVERIVLLKGWTVEAMRHDYGYDFVMYTYDYGSDTNFQRGGLESGSVYIQMKATDRLKTVNHETEILFRISSKHIELWRKEIMPVILIVYDVPNDIAFWIHIQNSFKTNSFTIGTEKTRTVRIPCKNTVDAGAIQQFRDLKEEILSDIRKRRNVDV